MSLLETSARILDIKITFQCNNLCRFCVAGDKRKAFADLPAQEIKDILMQRSGDLNMVVFTGGEPTLRGDLPELVRYAREDCGYETVAIQSNGRRFAYRAYAEELVAAGANQFSLSIHGNRAELHDYLTQQQGSFRETLLGIRNLLEMKQTLATNTVISKSGYFNLPDTAILLCALGVRQMQFAFPHVDGKALVNVPNVIPLMSLAAPYVLRALNIATRARRVPFTEGFPLCMLRGKEDHAVENLHSKRTVIDPQGDIDDFHGHRMTQLKAKGPDCPDCRHFETCEGPWADYPEIFSWKEFRPVK